MSIDTLREEIIEKIKNLPEEKLQRINDVISDQRILLVARPMSDEERARKAAAYAGLLKYKGSIDHKFDIKNEIAEAIREKYESIV